MATKKKNIDEVLRMNMESTGLDDESLDDGDGDAALGDDDNDEGDDLDDSEDEEDE